MYCVYAVFNGAQFSGGLKLDRNSPVILVENRFVRVPSASACLLMRYRANNGSHLVCACELGKCEMMKFTSTKGALQVKF